MSTHPSGFPQTAPSISSLAGNAPRRSWLGRNWKWLAAALFLGMLLFGFGLFALIMGVIRGSTVARDSIARARSNAAVVQRLGTPLSEGWLVSGSVNISSGTGDANLAVPITGPRGNGTVYAVAHMNEGMWTYDKLQVAIEGSSETIDLLAEPRAEAASSAPPSAPQLAAENSTQPAQNAPSGAISPTAPAVNANTAPTAAPPSTGSIIATAQDENDPSLHCDLLELKRLSGGNLLARWRLVNTGAKPVSYDFSWDDIYYIDPIENKKYNYLTIDNKRILDVWSGWLQPGEQHMMWAKYPAPSPTSKRVSLNVPKFTPFEDVVIAEQ